MADNSCPGWDPRYPRDIRIAMQSTVVDGVFYGIFACLIIMSTYTLVSQGLRQSYARIILLAVTISMFAISTAHLIITTLSFLIQWPYICATVAPDSFYAQLEWMNIAIDVMGRTQYFISDCVVVWRAWVIWYDKRWIRMFLLFSLLGTAVTGSVLVVLNVREIKFDNHYTALEWNMLGTFGLFVTNFGATIAIAVKAWLFRRSVKEFLNRGSSKSKVESVLTLLVESGAVYCIYWVVEFVTDFGVLGDFDIGWAQPNISGIYPTLIILLVALQRSTPENVFTISGIPSASPEPMRFDPASDLKQAQRSELSESEFLSDNIVDTIHSRYDRSQV
ncbi:uncharacterized protein STEHIDRAFT_173208 [Stereum hirsutum FP-91666 SS1]|uniref:Uncharacterized protein n=1 Tax=Stereum hirsutum (strain FP-91666) TaxID=721885 RepID=R7RWN4_STEHR|nr:uncharacterized protein STEHIDRAFT_173208 [Stereum hirsutum FP-91666 SS1]EIM79225.1 hypothetical protein STEHIDRAFT_173208 [Stereum hirsutum FP-91666 SS1]